MYEMEGERTRKAIVRGVHRPCNKSLTKQMYEQISIMYSSHLIFIPNSFIINQLHIFNFISNYIFRMDTLHTYVQCFNVIQIFIIFLSHSWSTLTSPSPRTIINYEPFSNSLNEGTTVRQDHMILNTVIQNRIIETQ